MNRANIAGFLAIATILLMAAPVFAAKSPTNVAGAIKVPWHLSGAVMPVPPYGSLDIPGSDTASKLIVNQPNGNTQMILEGVMGGLIPETEYTVYISGGYTPYVFTGWDLTGSYKIEFTLNPGPVPAALYDLTLTQTGNVLGGQGVYDGYAWNVVGSVAADGLTFTATYTSGAVGTTMNIVGTIASDGSISGTWDDNYPGPGPTTRTGTWYSTSGQATKDYTGSTGWPGLFTSTVPAFTFTSNAEGKAGWHVNLKKVNLAGLTAGSTYPMSVWINMAGATILISDTFTVLV